MRELRIAARGSMLSLAQVNMFIEQLLRRNSDLSVIVRTVRTTGDLYRNLPFTEIGAKGVFEREVNKAVLEGAADIAVHSLKDVPSEVNPKLVLAAVLPRDPPYDVLVVRRGEPSLDRLPRGAVIGTSSARRKAMILNYRRDLIVKPLRGNVDTRLRKLFHGEYDAIVLAEAGITRLGINVEYARLPPEIVTPAPSQGIIGIYARRDDSETLRIVSSVNDEKTMIEARAERAFLKRAGGGCHVPIGCLARLEGNALRISASLLDPEGRKRVDVELRGPASHAEELGINAAEILRRKGGDLVEA